jgi:hypothetical protein
MSDIKARIFICIDEHGNYRAIGSSSITDSTKNQAIAIIENEIKLEGVSATTTSFQVNVTLPEPTEKETQNEPNIDPIPE